TTMPSAAWAAHAAWSLGFPATLTRQMRQDPTVGSLGNQHNVGTSAPDPRAASRMVDPSGTVTVRPSMVRVIIFDLKGYPSGGGGATFGGGFSRGAHVGFASGFPVFFGR